MNLIDYCTGGDTCSSIVGKCCSAVSILYLFPSFSLLNVRAVFDILVLLRLRVWLRLRKWRQRTGIFSHLRFLPRNLLCGLRITVSFDHRDRRWLLFDWPVYVR